MSDKRKFNYAEDVNYWQTSTASSDGWIDKAKKEIAGVGGKILGEMFGQDAVSGVAAFRLDFQIAEDKFSIQWPVLQSKTRNERAAKIQAATILYHDVKGKCVAAKVFGARAAFFQYLLLPNGKTASEATDAEFLELVPRFMLTSGKS